MQVVVGQRWVSHTEAQLGLGLINNISGRRMEVSFPAVGETRVYAVDAAPLSRIEYTPGEVISNMNEEQFVVKGVTDEKGLLVYDCEDVAGQPCKVHELELNCFVQFTTPGQRLISGQFDSNRAYELRVDTLEKVSQLQQSSIAGLQGGRIGLLPHQLYIANEVSKRHAPRVLLADEVGLGKTIEAGMILHQQLHSGRANRVLIVVPESLVHQWLVEMLRRFNLSFAIYDEGRVSALQEEFEHAESTGSESTNPFEAEQRIICSSSFLVSDERIKSMVLETEWDMLVVDEAHHLVWSEEESSEEYQCVEQLSRQCQGLLLLTATPEQAGIESHFARLRLLDPARFYDLQVFKQEQEGYQTLNHIVELLQQLDDAANMAPTDVDAIKSELDGLLNDDLKSQFGPSLDQADARQQLIRLLLDQYGTGRILFRNTRNGVSGFPERNLFTYPQPCPSSYTDEFDQPMKGVDGLYPETLFLDDRWLQQDPRVTWLVEWLKEHKEEKVLLICHHADTAVKLDKYLNLKVGVRSSSFYEGMSILERDRAAAYFAEPEGGAQILVCSEIGSEGRNFQFAHHLIMFDLPTNPDLVEQRIGRLDRIGQTHPISIHIPYIKKGSQDILLRWYHEGLNLFEKSCSSGFSIFEHFSARLNYALSGELEGYEELIEDTAEYTRDMHIKLQEGRDRLMELNSCDHDKASKLVAELEEKDSDYELVAYMEEVFREFGVDLDDHSEATHFIRPGEQMRGDHFSGLKEEGSLITFNRQVAMSREDISFLSWEHPMVDEVMEHIQSGDFGNATVSTISLKGLKPGTLLLEVIYTPRSVAPKWLELQRYLPIEPIRLLIDANGKNLSAVMPHDKLSQLCSPLKKKVARTVVEQVRADVETMMERSKELALELLPAMQASAKEKMQQSLNLELQRLLSLKKVNPNIRDEEIEFLENKIKLCDDFIRRATCQMDGLRLIINS
ncbi:RNA polymerase-associated protein RapA [Pleionea sp. CnH1-48]|uniref:RNA polymerase-associated protein RapA n=1 Tax=Pleionea sp. CnH1-48 TaxID=2954494 RepID=UPI0020972D1A|nr:RNA polymerase-associated protein RapA [Pleionea sp. CnH1-48]MCO7224508.1 RNA polymerase-associated protein RapA [Pleionea sp. CnH1-48]